MSPAVALGLAVALEVAATSALSQSVQFTKALPTLLAIGGYVAAFYLLSLAMRTIPVGVVYALWSGFGMVLISVVGAVALGQRLDGWALLGIGLILAGVLVINLLSASVRHGA